jgi:hypothetical protein
MAAVSFAMPLLALGFAFLISSKEKVREKESFANKASPSSSVAASSASYSNTQKAEEDYVKQQQQQPQHYSLTGDPINMTDFKHQNQVPFYGAKMKGQVYGVDKAESILDNMVGAGSQTISKQEQAPLFDPTDNAQWANGTPNYSDFFQSRVNEPLAKNNTKPFETMSVGPGLNHGFSVKGSGGFNSGMEARESYMPKSVDDLRVATNPKVEYSLDDHQGPSYSHVQNLGIIGRVEKNRPDTFFAESPDMWFTTVNTEKKPMYRSEQQVNETARNLQSTSYAGNAGPGNKKASYAPQTFKQSTRTNLMTTETGPSVAINKGPSATADSLKSYKLHQNNRTSTKQPETFGSGFTNAIGAVVAPLMDVLNLTRRNDYGENVRLYGDAGTTVPRHFNANKYDKPKVTIKETTLYTPRLGATQLPTKQQPDVFKNNDLSENQRSTTGATNYMGTCGSAYGAESYSAAYNQHNNDLKEPLTFSRINHGNMQIYNEPQFNISMAKADNDRENNRMWVPTSLPREGISKVMINETRRPQSYQEPDRMESSLLKAFRENPYTQSLSSVA